jgi:hypothetical protein
MAWAHSPPSCSEVPGAPATGVLACSISAPISFHRSAKIESELHLPHQNAPRTRVAAVNRSATPAGVSPAVTSANAADVSRFGFGDVPRPEPQLVHPGERLDDRTDLGGCRREAAVAPRLPNNRDLDGSRNKIPLQGGRVFFLCS